MVYSACSRIVKQSSLTCHDLFAILNVSSDQWSEFLGYNDSLDFLSRSNRGYNLLISLSENKIPILEAISSFDLSTASKALFICLTLEVLYKEVVSYFSSHNCYRKNDTTKAIRGRRIEDFFKYLYSNATILMYRKYIKFNNIIIERSQTLMEHPTTEDEGKVESA